MPFSRDMEDFLLYCELTKQYSLNTVRNYRNTLERFKDFLNYKRIERTQDIDIDIINNYRQHLNRLTTIRKQKMSLKAQAYQIVVIRSFLKFMVKHGAMVLSPDKLELPKVRMQRIEYLTEPEVQKLISAILNDTNKIPEVQKKRNQAIILTMFGSGLRLSEMLSLRKAEAGGVELPLDHEQIEQEKFDNLEANEFINKTEVDAAENEDDTEAQPLLVKGKGSKYRTTYLAPAAKEAIKEYLELRGQDENPYLFISFSKNRPKDPKDWKPLTPRMVQMVLQQYARRLGIYKHITPHTLRHSFATKILAEGGDLRSVQTLLGHSNLATTQIYTHITNLQIRDLHSKVFGRNDKDKPEP
ncbi:MAG: tyrosine-type recombinase/integrase [Patescibacteria group bacterium]